MIVTAIVMLLLIMSGIALGIIITKPPFKGDIMLMAFCIITLAACVTYIGNTIG